MYIELTEEERNIVLQIAQEKATTEGITLESALKDLLGIGLSHYREMLSYREWRRRGQAVNAI